MNLSDSLNNNAFDLEAFRKALPARLAALEAVLAEFIAAERVPTTCRCPEPCFLHTKYKTRAALEVAHARSLVEGVIISESKG